MTTPPDLSQIGRALDAFQVQLAQVRANAPNETVRQQLAELAPRLKEAQGQFLAGYPVAMAAARKKLQDAEKQGQALQDEVDQLRKQAEAAEEAQRAAAAARPRPVGEAIDPKLGRTLRLEILERFGNGSPGGEAADESSELRFVAMLRKTGYLP
jgi:hypothetical protein